MEGYILLYTKDKLFNSYARKIIENIDIYVSNINRYNDCINILNPLIPYPDFEKEIGKLFRSRYGGEVSKEQRWSYFLKILYAVGLTGCRNIYPNGRSWVVELSRDNYLDLKNIVQEDVNSKKQADEISIISKNIKTSLTNVKNAVIDLHDNWQNSQYV